MVYGVLYPASSAGVNNSHVSALRKNSKRTMERFGLKCRDNRRV